MKKLIKIGGGAFFALVVLTSIAGGGGDSEEAPATTTEAPVIETTVAPVVETTEAPAPTTTEVEEPLTVPEMAEILGLDGMIAAFQPALVGQDLGVLEFEASVICNLAGSADDFDEFGLFLAERWLGPMPIETNEMFDWDIELYGEFGATAFAWKCPAQYERFLA